MQRLNIFTNNKNNVDLGVDNKDLVLGMSADNQSTKNKNIQQNGFVDITAFNSEDLMKTKKQIELGISPNVIITFYKIDLRMIGC